MNSTANRKTFQIKYKNPDTGEVTTGQFTTKRLSVRDRGQIGVKKSQLNGGMYCVRDDANNPTGQGIDEDTDYLNGMLAHLEICLIQRPDWWNLDELADLGLVQEVYQEVVDFEVSFFRPPNGAADQGGSGQVGQGDSSVQPERTEPGNTPTPVVDGQVQASLDA